ncbi:hypothetical protein [Sulfurovum sp.]|uniref:hypothetical protein n=1 Tax=Sulfurovum sp. TaxID=1969726 RepID=UPI003561BE72
MVALYQSIGDNWILVAIAGVVISGVVTFLYKKFNGVAKLLWKNFRDKYWYNLSYKIIGFRKHVTVFKNGHGIILHDIELNIYKVNEMFTKRLDISDAPTMTLLPDLEEMKKTEVERRFDSFGFWFSSTPKNVLKNVIEVPERSNHKKKAVKFIFDKTEADKLKGAPVKILYGFSIPKLYPVKDGKFEEGTGGVNPIQSNFEVQYPMSYYDYVIGLEDGVKVSSIKSIYHENGTDNAGKEEDMIEKDDLFYTKFVLSLKRPKVGSTISTYFTLE